MTKSILSALLVLFLGSCAATPYYAVYVDSLAAQETPAGQRFSLEHEAETVDPLVWGEISAAVRRTLEARGWRAATSDEAELVVYVSCSISGPEEYSYTTSSPVYGQVGETTTYTPGNEVLGTSASSTTTAEYGVTHYDRQQRTGVRYHRRLRLTATSVGGTRDEPLWRTSTLSTGSGSDMRRLVPALLLAAEPWLGRSTGQVRYVQVAQDDEGLQRIAGGVR